MKGMGSLTAATHTARLAAAVMASGAVSAVCQTPCGEVQQPKTLKRTQVVMSANLMCRPMPARFWDCFDDQLGASYSPITRASTNTHEYGLPVVQVVELGLIEAV